MRIKKRSFIQVMAMAFTNAYVVGFAKGKIYTGNTKLLCVPGLNCYSCPGAIGSCPIGALQAVLGARNYGFTYYVIGMMVFFGVLLGRLVCGFLCPFGWIQEVLFFPKTPKLSVPTKLDHALRYVKYGMLFVPVILLPMFATNSFGMAPPYFCQWICPVGTLAGGVPLLIWQESLRNRIGFLFYWKSAILLCVVFFSIVIYRPFCKYLCPLGAFYGMFHRYGFYRMHIDENRCVGCKECEKSCKMGVEVTKNINSPECIRCGDCFHTCRYGAIEKGWEFSCQKVQNNTLAHTKYYKKP